jgi:SAM-dependent methyltransferase
MGVRRKLAELRWRMAGHYRRRLPNGFIEPLRGGRGLEVGGPSALFREDGLLPVYPVLSSIDGVQWASDTAWHALDPSEGYCPEGARRGSLRIVDDVDLSDVQSDSYDVVFSSHVIEHIANPLRALAAWQRVTRPGGFLLIVVPHMEGTFDHRRQVTSLEHLIGDRDRGVAEDDLTHLDETLRLHDHALDAPMIDQSSWEEERRANATTRLLHHHTFTTPSLLRLLDHAGLKLLEAETRFPHDIYVLGSWPEGRRADNEAFMERGRPSPFSADRWIRGRGSSGFSPVSVAPPRSLPG